MTGDYNQLNKLYEQLEPFFAGLIEQECRVVFIVCPPKRSTLPAKILTGETPSLGDLSAFDPKSCEKFKQVASVMRMFAAMMESEPLPELSKEEPAPVHIAAGVVS